MSPLWTSLIQALRGRTCFCSAIYRSCVGITRVRPNSSCWEILPWKPCPLQCHNEPLWHSLGKWSRCSFPFLGCCGALGGPDRMRRKFGLKSLILFCSSLDVVSMGQEQTAQFVDCIVDFFRAFRKWIGKTGIRRKATKGHYQCAEKLYNVSGSNFLSFHIVL